MQKTNNQEHRQEDGNELVRQIAEQKYEFGFTTDVHTEIIPVGLNEDVVRLISAKKGEPDWLLEFRLKAFRHWLTMRQPEWGHVTLLPIDYQAISYYADPTAKKASPTGGAVEGAIDPELEKTFDKLGIPLEERLALSGNTAVCKASSDNHFAFLHFFFLGMVLITVSCTKLRTSIHSSSGTLSLESICHFH